MPYNRSAQGRSEHNLSHVSTCKLAVRATMERPRGMAVQHTVSVGERTSKARTAFLGFSLARIAGGCMEEHS